MGKTCAWVTFLNFCKMWHPNAMAYTVHMVAAPFCVWFQIRVAKEVTVTFNSCHLHVLIIFVKVRFGSVRFGSAELFCRTVRFGPNSKVQKFGSVRFGRTQNSRVEVRFGSVRHKKIRFGSPLNWNQNITFMNLLSKNYEWRDDMIDKCMKIQ